MEPFPKSLIEFVEELGGVFLEAAPPMDIKGAVCVIRVHREPLEDLVFSDATFLFPEFEKVQQCITRLGSLVGQDKFDFEGWKFGMSQATDVDTYYYCGFCGEKRSSEQPLTLGLRNGASICVGCVRRFQQSVLKQGV